MSETNSKKPLRNSNPDNPEDTPPHCNQRQKIKINLKGVLEDSLITLNNLRDVEIENNEDSITLTFEK